MNNESLQLSLYLSTGLYFLAMVVEVVGFFLCLAFRHLSGWTILVAAGFAGMFAAGAVSRLVGLRWLFPSIVQDLMGPMLVVGGAIYLLSLIAVVWGLWMSFVEFQRRLAMALEPKDGWR